MLLTSLVKMLTIEQESKKQLHDCLLQKIEDAHMGLKTLTTGTLRTSPFWPPVKIKGFPFRHGVAFARRNLANPFFSHSTISIFFNHKMFVSSSPTNSPDGSPQEICATPPSSIRDKVQDRYVIPPSITIGLAPSGVVNTNQSNTNC